MIIHDNLFLVWDPIFETGPLVGASCWAFSGSVWVVSLAVPPSPLAHLNPQVDQSQHIPIHLLNYNGTKHRGPESRGTFPVTRSFLVPPMGSSPPHTSPSQEPRSKLWLVVWSSPSPAVAALPFSVARHGPRSSGCQQDRPGPRGN